MCASVPMFTMGNSVMSSGKNIALTIGNSAGIVLSTCGNYADCNGVKPARQIEPKNLSARV